MIKQQIAEAIQNRTPLHIKNAFNIDIPWDDFIGNINLSIKEKSDEPGIYPKYGRVGDVRFYDRLTLVLDNALKFNYTGIDNIIETIKSYDLEPAACMCLISLTDAEGTTSQHSDPYNALYVQCIGSVQWSVWINKVEHKFILNKGDFIFVPSKLVHEVVSLTPRAALSFMVK